MKYFLEKLGLSATTSIVLTESLNLDVLWNALITLAVSIISVLSVEGVNFLIKWIKKKTEQIDNEESKEK